MPSAHVPAHVFEHPTHAGGIDCHIWVRTEPVAELRGYLTNEVGSRGSYLGWPGITAEFEVMAQSAWEELGNPTTLLEFAWESGHPGNAIGLTKHEFEHNQTSEGFTQES
ncbi:hypothetical protein DFH07DRAFT_781625 [Mycena maculata]|uniref:Uncharacterized protein n=1 Tax=Mycena maculata TaxID=230809 RepID=A0AAD7HXA2_9AGAR|nr:hypothetical protein DFH07DRAFT_781625 [Mycena maculata]